MFKQTSREVSVADPNVDKVQIIVEASTLDMDREASYNALNGLIPKEPYILLYKTFRSFNDYTLSLDENELGLGNDADKENGSLILATARKLRITIRAFCSTEQTDYFGDKDFRFSTPVKRDVMQTIESLEAAPLFKAPSAPTDALISIFFRPEAAKTAEERRAAAARGEQNQADVNIIERLASACGFVKNGQSVLGKENERVQFGCSNLIGHTLSPDHSSLTFGSMDDLSRKWISVIQLDLKRDWCWDMLAQDSFEVFRQWKYKRNDWIGFEEGDEEKIGVIGLTKGLNWQNMPEPDRLKTRLVFIDALNPKPGATPKDALQVPSKFPEPIDVRYLVSPQFNKAINFDSTAYDYTTQPHDLENTLPIKDAPSQVPEIVSVG